MASELPAVATPVGDVPELFDGLRGYCVRDPAPPALADGLERALAAGRVPEARAVAARYDVAVTTRRLIAVYDAVA
jgi:glycosyltransferase involved in cell wall biosynthesis